MPSTNSEGYHYSCRCPEEKCAVDKDDHWISDQVATINIGIGLLCVKDPANVGMEEAFDGAMRIAFTIRVRMVFYMGSCPFKCMPLQSHRAENEQDKFNHRMGPEAAMCEHPVKSDGYTECREGIHDEQQSDV